MNTTEPERKPGTQTENKHRTEPLWNVIWHNEWENPLRWVTLVLRKVIVGITLERATKTAWVAVQSVADTFSNQRFGRLRLLRYRISRLELVGFGVAQFAFLRGADAFDTSRLPGPEDAEGRSIAVQEG
jgi:hypothetical protein